MTWNIALENLTDAEKDAAAAEYFLIKIRRDFSKDKKPTATKWDGATFDAKNWVTKKSDPVAKAQKAIAGFSDEMLAALGLSRVSK